MVSGYWEVRVQPEQRMRLLMRALEPGALTRLQTEWTERQENTPKFSPEAGKTSFFPQPNARGTTGGILEDH